jgi:hypothetical protein
MKTLTLAALALATLAPAAQAGVGSSLGSCYNHVISACNQSSNHPQACATAGMDACDELFEAKASLPPGARLKILAKPARPGEPPVFSARFVWPDDGRDDGRDGGRDEGRDDTGREPGTGGTDEGRGGARTSAAGEDRLR